MLISRFDQNSPSYLSGRFGRRGETLSSLEATIGGVRLELGGAASSYGNDVGHRRADAARPTRRGRGEFHPIIFRPRRRAAPGEAVAAVVAPEPPAFSFLKFFCACDLAPLAKARALSRVAANSRRL